MGKFLAACAVLVGVLFVSQKFWEAGQDLAREKTIQEMVNPVGQPKEDVSDLISEIEELRRIFREAKLRVEVPLGELSFCEAFFAYEAMSVIQARISSGSGGLAWKDLEIEENSFKELYKEAALRESKKIVKVIHIPLKLRMNMSACIYEGNVLFPGDTSVLAVYLEEATDVSSASLTSLGLTRFRLVELVEADIAQNLKLFRAFSRSNPMRESLIRSLARQVEYWDIPPERVGFTSKEYGEALAGSISKNPVS